jgi:hypothetical protein
MANPIALIPALPAGTPIADRVAAGKQARKALPRKDLGRWRPSSDRPRPVDLIKQQATTRIPQLVPIRHARMAVSPFTFFRGSAVVMAADLGLSPHTGLYSQLCGDAHLANLGVFGSAERNLVFDLNDFDETSPGPFEWDLLRLAASFVLAARDNQLGPLEGETAVRTLATAYQRAAATAAAQPLLTNFYTMFTSEQIMTWARDSDGVRFDSVAQKRMTKQVGKIRARDSWSAVRKLTEIGPDGERRFLTQPPLLIPLSVAMRDFGFAGIDFQAIYDVFLRTLDIDRQALLSRYQIIDVAHKVVGVGSVGLPALVGLLQGRDADDLLVLQFKAAEASVLERWTAPSPFAEHGQRVVVGQRLMQATGDPFLGWVTGPAGVGVYGRQLRDFKWSPDLAGLDKVRLNGYAAICGKALAMAHARAGDPIAISAYAGSGEVFSQAISDFAQTYANLVEADYADFTEAIADGEIPAASPTS